MNNRGFTLIELLVVIAILAIITVMGVTTILPYMAEAREDAFRIEASEVVTAAKDAKRLYEIGQLSLKNNTASCKSQDSTLFCFTVAELIDLALYDGDPETFSGRVEIDSSTDAKVPTYYLWFKKNAEFNIIGGTRENYKEHGNVNEGSDWQESYASCDCS